MTHPSDNIPREIVTISSKDGFVTFYDVRGVIIAWTRINNEIKVSRDGTTWFTNPVNVCPGDIIKQRDAGSLAYY